MEIEQNMPKSENIQNLCYLTLAAYISEKMAPHPYMSYIFKNVLISSLTRSAWNWSYDMKIPPTFPSENEKGILAKSLYFTPIPIVN